MVIGMICFLRAIGSMLRPRWLPQKSFPPYAYLPGRELSLLAMIEGATVTVFDGRFGELAAWARAGRACRRACGGQDVAWKGR